MTTQVKREDLRVITSRRVKPSSPPSQVAYMDMGFTNDYQTQNKVSYHQHPLPQKMTPTQRRTSLQSNLNLQTHPGEAVFHTTQSLSFPPHAFQRPPTPIRHTEAIKKIQQVEKLPESTNQASFIRHHSCPVQKPKVKHLEVSFSTIRGDGRRHCLVSEYANKFLGTWSTAAQSVRKHTSSVAIGDPMEIAEKETTHSASFSWPPDLRGVGGHRPSQVKDHVKLNFGNFSKNSWSSTSREAFCAHKHGPRVPIRRVHLFSSMPWGTDTRHNQEKMYETTNRISFSDLTHTLRPVCVPAPELRTKSHIQFSPPCLAGLYYTTTTKEHHDRKDAACVKPTIQPPSNILRGPERGPYRSTTQSDYVPVKGFKLTRFQPKHTTNIRFPFVHQHISTTQRDDYIPKPLTLVRPARCQRSSHFVMQ